MRRGSEPKLTDFGDHFLPEEAIEPNLARPVRKALLEWLTEIWAEDKLTEVGIEPRRRAIFDGAPGTGKTTLAHHLAARLGLPMLAVRPDLLFSKWVHETAENIGALFEAAKNGLGDDAARTPIVLFIDEFDAVAGKRRAVMQSTDDLHNQDIDTLLQRIEQHDGFLIAATNHAAHVDPAIWRRFDIHITLELPGQDERERILTRYLAPFGLPPAPLRELARSLETASPALMRDLCENLKRQLVIGPMLERDMSRGAVFERILASCHPHPDCGKPKLWSLGPADSAIAGLPWPLPKAAQLGAPEKTGIGGAVSAAGGDNVVILGKRK